MRLVHSDRTAEHPRRLDKTATWFFRPLHTSCTTLKMESKDPPKHRNTLTSYSLPLLRGNKTRIIKMKEKVGSPHNIKVHGGKRGIAPLILNVDSRRRWAKDFTHRPIYPWGKNSTTPWAGGWVGLRAGLDDLGGKKLLPLLGFKQRTYSLHRLLYSGSHELCVGRNLEGSVLVRSSRSPCAYHIAIW